jgi:hypothetical protein
LVPGTEGDVGGGASVGETGPEMGFSLDKLTPSRKSLVSLFRKPDLSDPALAFWDVGSLDFLFHGNINPFD